MLSSDDVQDLFGDVLGDLYEDAVLVTYTRSATRDATGGFPKIPTNTDVKAQRDVCTQRQMSLELYSAKDVRLMVLQSGISVVPNTDSEIEYRSERYTVMDVDQDPFRVYWDLLARKKTTS